MIHTDEDDELYDIAAAVEELQTAFTNPSQQQVVAEIERIAHEAEMKKGQPYHYDVYVSPSQRNTVLEEVAKEFEKMTAFGDTSWSFAAFVRNMKK